MRRPRTEQHKFPLQVPVATEHKQKFMKELAIESISFEKLVQTGIPHG